LYSSHYVKIPHAKLNVHDKLMMHLDLIGSYFNSLKHIISMYFMGRVC